MLGDHSVPVVLGSRALQQLVAVLARYGTLRLADAADAVGVVDLSLESNLLASRVVLLSAPGRKRFIALNSRLPAFRALAQCIKRVEPATDWRPRFSAVHAIVRDQSPQRWEHALFGHEVRLKVMLALEALGGKASAAQIGKTMSLSRGRAQAILRRMLQRNVLTRTSLRHAAVQWAFPDAAWSQSLRLYLRQLLGSWPDLVESASLAMRDVEVDAKRRPGKRKRARYKGVPLRTMVKPVGWCIPANRAPLLFSNDARRRVLEVIALMGNARFCDIERLSESNPCGPLRHLMKLGVVQKRMRGHATVYSIAQNLPGREHLVELLHATAAKFSPNLANVVPRRAAPARGVWLGRIEAIFGYESRGTALIGARATGGVDASTLRMLNPDVERVQCRRVLHLFTALKVLRTCREGSAILYELNPKWFAFPQLAAFIDALIAASPAHQHWRDVVRLVQAPSRRKMAENARQRSIRRRRA